MICGRNTRTLPTPEITPFCTKLCNSPSGSTVRDHAPSASKPAVISSIAGWAQANTAWNITNNSSSSAIMPHTGCSSTASTRVVQVSGLAGSLTAARITRSASRCAARRSAMAGVVHSLAAMAAAGVATMPSIRRSSSSMPPRRTAVEVTTGTPSSSDSLSRSISMPRRRAMSIMLSTSSIGRRTRLSSITSRSATRRLVASATQSRKSGGASLASLPRMTSRAISSSGLRPRSE